MENPFISLDEKLDTLMKRIGHLETLLTRQQAAPEGLTPTYVTLDQAARMLGYTHTNAIHDLCRQGYLTKHYPPGIGVRLLYEDVKNYGKPQKK